MVSEKRRDEETLLTMKLWGDNKARVEEEICRKNEQFN
jgi:hypothetical protein